MEKFHSEGQFLPEPLKLHETVSLSSDDIQSEIKLDTALGNEITRRTNQFHIKEGFPTYSIIPDFKHQDISFPVVIILSDSGTRCFKLKPEANVLKEYAAYRLSKTNKTK